MRVHVEMDSLDVDRADAVSTSSSGDEVSRLLCWTGVSLTMPGGWRRYLV